MGCKVKLIRNLLFNIFIATVFARTLASTPCALKDTEYGKVCVCTATYCDYLDDPTPESEHEFRVISSSKAGLRFEQTDGRFKLFKVFYVLDHDLRYPEQTSADSQSTADKKRDINKRYARIHIDREQQYQKIIGFGGSFTGAVSHILQQLPQELQDHVYESFYSERGIGFSLMRMSIGGCDFDLEPWAYNEQPENDPELSNFNELDPRDQIRVEQIKRLKEVSQVKNLRIKGAAWSSPVWMKSNNAWTGRSHLKEEYYQTWADYHLKWVELMDKNGLPVWAISTGNEPLNGVYFMYFVKFMSLGWQPKQQGIWLADHLGPTIRNSAYKDLIIFSNDDQRFTFPRWFDAMKSVRANAVDYLDGLSVHWYWNDIFKPLFIDKACADMPDKLLISSESCVGDKPWQKAVPLLGSWSRGEKYARAMLEDLQHSFNGWIDWNIVLDENGGPNYVNNTVDAPVIVDMKNPTEFYKQPIYYVLGHFSKFVPEGSVRIASERTNVNVDSVAFLRPDGTIAIIAFNSGEANLELSVVDSVLGTVIINLPPKSIHTILYK